MITKLSEVPLWQVGCLLAGATLSCGKVEPRVEAQTRVGASGYQISQYGEELSRLGEELSRFNIVLGVPEKSEAVLERLDAIATTELPEAIAAARRTLAEARRMKQEGPVGEER